MRKATPAVGDRDLLVEGRGRGGADNTREDTLRKTEPDSSMTNMKRGD